MNKHVKKILIAVSIMLVVLVLAAAGYFIYVAASYSRMDDNLRLAAKNNTNATLPLDKELEILTYDISYGAFCPQFSSYFDKGELGGKKVKGKYGKGMSRDDVRRNTDGIAGIIGNFRYDFVFAQEVDEDGNRSYHINQREWLEGVLPSYCSVYAKDLHTPYLCLPPSDPYGKNDSGLLTMSKYKVDEALRKSLPVSDGISKYADSDACFSVTRVNAGEKQLVLVNVRFSAGEVLGRQLDVFFEFLEGERQKDNFVVVGGDFEFDICGSANTFPTQQTAPDMQGQFAEQLPSGYSFAEANNKATVPTCRSGEIPYEKGVSYTAVVDGFIISDNIEAVKVSNQDTGFAYSKHNPVFMRFKLKE